MATNEQWAAPVEASDRRYAVFDVSSDRRGDRAYFTALSNQMNNGGREAWLHDLLAYDLSNFDVRAIPQTSARDEQKILTLRGVDRWLHTILNEGEIRCGLGVVPWADQGRGSCEITKAAAYDAYVEHSKKLREHHPEAQPQWAREVWRAMGPCLTDRHPRGEPRRFKFASLQACRDQFAAHLNAPDLQWGQGGV